MIASLAYVHLSVRAGVLVYAVCVDPREDTTHNQPKHSNEFDKIEIMANICIYRENAPGCQPCHSPIKNQSSTDLLHTHHQGSCGEELPVTHTS